MKKTILISFLVIILSIYSCNDNSTNPDNIQSETKKKWTYIFYNDADFTNAYNPTADFAARMTSNENLDVIILEDLFGAEAKYLYVEENSEVTTIENLGEVNMGSKTTLSNLLKFAKEKYPAERYILAMYNHGSGAMGACIDNTDEDILSMWEINKALEENDGVDFLLFTAPCLMGAFESIYQVRENVEYYIGSENLSGFMWWFETLPEMNQKINATPDISNKEFAKFTIDKLYSKNLVRYPDDVDKYLTMSAVETKNIKLVADSFSKITSYYVNNYEKFKNFCDDHYSEIRCYYDYSIDFYDFCDKLESYETNDEIVSELKNIKSLIKNCVVANCFGLNQTNSNGFSLYFPKNNRFGINSRYYNDDPLFFNTDTKWVNLIRKYCDPSTSSSQLKLIPHINEL